MGISRHFSSTPSRVRTGDLLRESQQMELHDVRALPGHHPFAASERTRLPALQRISGNTSERRMMPNGDAQSGGDHDPQPTENQKAGDYQALPEWSQPGSNR